MSSWSRWYSHLQHLGDAGEIHGSRGGHVRDVLDAHAAEAEVVEAGLHGDHVTGAEDASAHADRRGLVDLQAEAVPGPVEEALHPPILDPGAKAAGLEQ